MNPGNQLVIGIILIASGLALAILGYVIFTNRQEQEEDAEIDPGEESSIESPVVEAEEEIVLEEETVDADAVNLPPWVVPQAETELEVVGQDFEEEKAEPQPPLDEVTADEHAASVPASEEAPGPETPSTDPMGKPGETFQRSEEIVTLARDEVTGKLLILINEKTYSSPASLRNAPEWERVQYAARDLMEWMATDAVEQEKTEREPDAPSKPKSMIQQINDILQEEIKKSGVVHRGIRLMETPDGAVKVLLGVQSYALDEVPDKNVQALIRKAVSIWENQQ